MGEHTHGHHTRPVVDLALERQRIRDLQARDVHDVLTVVGHQRLAIELAHHGVRAHGLELAHDASGGHGDDFHGQGERAQGAHQLALIGDADELRGLCGDDFFACEGCAAAFDHVALVVDFIGAIDVHRQAFHLVAVEHRNAQGFQAQRRGFGAGDGALDLVLHGGQRIDEFVHCGTCAHADDLAGHNVLKGGLAHQGFEFVLGHGVFRV